MRPTGHRYDASEYLGINVVYPEVQYKPESQIKLQERLLLIRFQAIRFKLALREIKLSVPINDTDSSKTKQKSLLTRIK